MLYALHEDHKQPKFPQIRDAKLPVGKSVEDANYIDKFHHVPLPKDAFVPEIIYLQKGAKITHIVSASWPGLSSHLIISKQLKEIIKPVSTSFSFLPTTLATEKGDYFPYYIMYTVFFTFDAQDGIFLEKDFYFDKNLDTEIFSNVEVFAVKNYGIFHAGYIITENIKTKIEALSLHGAIICELNKSPF